jgi:CubicO group peptidase (beta-lactamase class C family)
MFNKVSEFLNEAIAQRIFPGCTVGIAVKGQVWYGAYGKFTYEPDARQVDETTVYDVASITKAIPVACCTLKLIEDGLLSVNDRLIDLLPEFSGGYRESILIRHLLTHTIDFGFRLSSIKDLKGNVIMDRILSAPLCAEPGATFSYANATSILLGLVIERRSGMSLDVAADNYFFKPLSMQATTFHPETLAMKVVAPSEYDSWRGRVICAEVHDESAYALRPKVVGAAGLFSTAPDLLRFAGLLLNEGSFAGVTLFKKETVSAMYTNVLPVSIGTTTGLGWELDQQFMGRNRSRQTFGKTGFTGCSIVVDPVRKAGVVLLSNHHFPYRRENRSIINGVRSELADLVFNYADAVQ